MYELPSFQEEQDLLARIETKYGKEAASEAEGIFQSSRACLCPAAAGTLFRDRIKKFLEEREQLRCKSSSNKGKRIRSR